METSRRTWRVATIAACLVAGWLGSVGARAESAYLTAFNSLYSSSTTGSARCVVCHGVTSSGSTDFGSFNGYGLALASLSGTIEARLPQVESADSDGEGHSNRQEIDANAQPGWCVATTPGCNNRGFAAPSSIALLDPPAGNEVPTADPGGPYTATEGVAVKLDGSGSSDPDGSVVSYAWNFGDGSTGSGVSPSVIYASAGTYTVTLTVSDDGGATSAAATTTVTVNAGLLPPVADVGGPYSGTVATPISFDGTGSSDPDGSIVSYAWDFGDGSTGNGPAPSHVYAAGGAFTVTLTVTDSDNLQDTATANVSVSDASGTQPPVADAGGPYSGKTGIAIQFDGSGSTDPDGTVAAYDWDFGDGNGTSGATPVHTYAAAGSYTVTLTVTDDTGRNDSDSASVQVSGPVNQAPTADPGGPYTAQPGAAVAFDGTGSSDPDGPIVSYAWNFGDGAAGSGPAPTHAYAADGDYLVTLVVTDEGGADSAMASTKVTVRSADGGEALYMTNCADCHGDPWDGPAVDGSLPGLKRVAGARVCTIEGAIFGTSVFPSGVPEMVGYGNQGLTTADIEAIAGYLNSRDADGGQRYVTACAGCHGNDGRGGRVDEGVRGEDTGDIREAIEEERTMRFLSCLPSSDVQLMAAHLAGTAGSAGGSASCDDDHDDDCDDDKDKQKEKRKKCKHDDDCDGDGRRDDEDDDDDNDGMPDDYEDSKGFNKYDRDDARDDADGDGKTNLAEYKAGTDPLDATSTPSAFGGGGSTGPFSLLGLTVLWLAGRRRRAERPLA
jgi:PKD repeat protein